MYLVVDENEQFREDNFLKLQDKFTKQKQMGESQSRNSKSSGRITKGGNASGGSDIYKIVKLRLMNILGSWLGYELRST
nr:DExH-box ATP-dependent RNA helicase DExH10 [Tanacetum cinerariifolium]